MPLTDTRFNSLGPGAAAEEGGIPLCVPHLGGRESEYVAECLATNFVSSVGPFVPRFEQAISDFLGGVSAVATVNGTASLHLALLAAGVEVDDEVMVSTLSFIAPANAIRYCGAWPVFIDSEPDYWQMNPAAVADFLETRCESLGGVTTNRFTGRRVRAIVPVHILGHPVDMDPLLELARRYGLVVVEDATESLGARYRNRTVGTLGQIGCLSFNGNKLITTGGGGMVVTSDRKLAQRCRYLSTQAKDDPVEYVHGAIGYNYRLNNIAAALGCAQMERIGEHISAKRRIATSYASALSQIRGLSLPGEASWAHAVFWLTTITVDRGAYGLDSRDLMRTLQSRGISTRPLWQPLHLSPAHAKARSNNPLPCPIAERIAEQALSLPSSVGLTTEMQSRVTTALTETSRIPKTT
ncbi:MAG: LegC family aminotransferase [Gemmatimonadaceae bacterium]